MNNLHDASVASIGGRLGRRTVRRPGHRLERVAEGATSGEPSALRSELGSLRASLGPLIDGYRHAAIGVTGVFDRDKSQSIAALLAREVVEQESLTTTIARVTRSDVVTSGGGARGAPVGQRTPRPRSLNIWPSARPEADVFHAVDPLELLHWLRCENEFTVVTFDNLGDVFTRLPLARRLEGMLVVNSGRDADLDLMGSAVEILERERVRILGQILNVPHEDEQTPRASYDVA